MTEYFVILEIEISVHTIALTQRTHTHAFSFLRKIIDLIFVESETVVMWNTICGTFNILHFIEHRSEIATSGEDHKSYKTFSLAISLAHYTAESNGTEICRLQATKLQKISCFLRGLRTNVLMKHAYGITFIVRFK